MTTWNQADLYILRIISQTPGSRKRQACVEVVFENLAIDQSYFGECMRSAFEHDDDVLKVVGDKKVIFLRSAVLDPTEAHSFLEQKSKMLLKKLSQHSDWGRVGGPNLMAEHEGLE